MLSSRFVFGFGISAIFIFFTFLLSVTSGTAGPPLLHKVPSTSFSCEGRPGGYYGDVEAECQAYHMCGINSRQYSYLCPNYTLFHQKYMVCDHWDAVDCLSTTKYYDLNLKIGKVPERRRSEIQTNLVQKKKSTSLSNRNIGTTSSQRKTQPDKTASKFSFGSSFRRNEPLPQVNRRQHSSNTALIPNKRINGKSEIVQNRNNSPFSTKTSKFPSRSSSKNPFSSTQRRNVSPIRSKISPRKSKTPQFSIREQSLRANNFRTKKLPIGGRKSSDRMFRFGVSAESSDERQGRLNTLLKEPRKALFDQRTFTIPSHFLVTTPSPPSSLSEEKESTRVFKTVPQLGLPEIPGFRLAPATNRNRKGEVEAPTPFLLPPPPEAPIIINGQNQEIRTQLVLKERRPHLRRAQTPSLNLNLVPPERSHFFIPSPGFLSPLQVMGQIFTNVSGINIVQRNGITMIFPNGKSSLLPPVSSPLNPNCPQCHPAFLNKDKCTPCVIIK